MAAARIAVRAFSLRGRPRGRISSELTSGVWMWTQAILMALQTARSSRLANS